MHEWVPKPLFVLVSFRNYLIRVWWVLSINVMGSLVRVVFERSITVGCVLLPIWHSRFRERQARWIDCFAGLEYLFVSLPGYRDRVHVWVSVRTNCTCWQMFSRSCMASFRKMTIVLHKIFRLSSSHNMARKMSVLWCFLPHLICLCYAEA